MKSSDRNNPIQDLKKVLNVTYTEKALIQAVMIEPGIDDQGKLMEAANGLHQAMKGISNTILHELENNDQKWSNDLLQYETQSDAVKNIVNRQSAYLLKDRWGDLARQYDTVDEMLENLNVDQYADLVVRRLNQLNPDNLETGSFPDMDEYLDGMLVVASRLGSATRPIARLEDRLRHDRDLTSEQKTDLWNILTGASEGDGMNLDTMSECWMDYIDSSIHKLTDYILDQTDSTEDSVARSMTTRSLYAAIEPSARQALINEYGHIKQGYMSGQLDSDRLNRYRQTAPESSSFPKDQSDSSPWLAKSLDDVRSLFEHYSNVVTYGSDLDSIRAMAPDQPESESPASENNSSQRMGQ